MNQRINYCPNPPKLPENWRVRLLYAGLKTVAFNFYHLDREGIGRLIKTLEREKNCIDGYIQKADDRVLNPSLRKYLRNAYGDRISHSPSITSHLLKLSRKRAEDLKILQETENQGRANTPFVFGLCLLGILHLLKNDRPAKDELFNFLIPNNGRFHRLLRRFSGSYVYEYTCKYFPNIRQIGDVKEGSAHWSMVLKQSLEESLLIQLKESRIKVTRETLTIYSIKAIACTQETFKRFLTYRGIDRRPSSTITASINFLKNLPYNKKLTKKFNRLIQTAPESSAYTSSQS